jgi:hypothetical protein
MMLASAQRLSRPVAVTIGASFLIWSGRTPHQVTRAIAKWRSQPRTATREQLLDALLAGAGWLIVLMLGVSLTYRVVISVFRVSRILARVARDQTPQTFFGMFLTFFVGYQGSSVHELSAEVPADSRLHDSNELRPNGSASVIAASTQSTPYLLPALASAGLALGVTKQIEKDRALLLRDAPSSAQLQRPDSISVSTGIALFERAKTAETTVERSVTANLDAVVLPLGMDAGRLVSLTIRPGEVVSVEAPGDDSEAVLRHVFNTVALAPWLQRQIVVVCGFALDEVVVDSRVAMAGSPSEARQLALSAQNHDGGSLVVVVARSHSPDLDDLPGRGVMVVTTGWASKPNVTKIIREKSHWRISTTDETFLPYGIYEGDVKSIRSAMKSMTKLETASVSARERSPHGLDRNEKMITTTASLMVRVLGPVRVLSAQNEVTFRKAKSLELLCWLAFHRDCPTVSGARTALWEVNVKDATFHNVLSELRHGLNASGLVNGAGRINKHCLFLDERISTDAENLRDALIAVESKSSESSVRRLQQSLLHVRGLPFSSVSYAWADAEGITSTLVWQVTRAVEHVARIATAQGDRTTLLDAVAAGLRMSPGEETFLELEEIGRLRT